VELILAIAAGVLYGTGFYLLLRRRLAQLIIGLGLLSNGTNLLIFTAGGLTRARPPLVLEGAQALTPPFADPVPQALVLTAIVISFATTSLLLVVLLAARGFTGTDHVDGRESEE
jgi:multisubunit Na+/H+ antiporter MnhC subunit